jgi:hypothetical protein
MMLYPEYITRAGKKEYAVLPYEEFLALQEEIEQAEDILALRAVRQENANAPGISMDEMKQRLGLTA